MTKSRPVAIVTVNFDRLISGKELIDAVGSLSEGLHTSFRQDHWYDDGDVFFVGQDSPYPYRQLVVSPARRVRGVRRGQLYSAVEVMSHQWPGQHEQGKYSYSAVIDEVKQFAAHLENFFADKSHASIWPQDVVVCAICETITWWEFGQELCPRHGREAPTKTVRVTLAE